MRYFSHTLLRCHHSLNLTTDLQVNAFFHWVRPCWHIQRIKRGCLFVSLDSYFLNANHNSKERNREGWKYGVPPWILFISLWIIINFNRAYVIFYFINAFIHWPLWLLRWIRLQTLQNQALKWTNHNFITQIQSYANIILFIYLYFLVNFFRARKHVPNNAFSSHCPLLC